MWHDYLEEEDRSGDWCREEKEQTKAAGREETNRTSKTNKTRITLSPKNFILQAAQFLKR
jgi:hypothetical protein